MKYFILFLMLFSSVGYSGGYPYWGANDTYPNFTFDNYGDDIRILGGYGFTAVLTLSLEKETTMKPWQAALLSSIIIGTMGTFRELANPQIGQGGYIQSWWMGSALAGATFTVLQF